MPVQEAATTVTDQDDKTGIDTEITLPRARVSGAPTLELVAAESGVSRSTRLPGGERVPEGAAGGGRGRQRRDRAPRLHARPSRPVPGQPTDVRDRPARARTGDDVLNDPFFASVVQGITERMEDSDYILNLLVSSSDPSRKTRRYLRGGNVDGAFVVSHHAADRDLADLCDIMPVVFGGRPWPTSRPATTSTSTTCTVPAGGRAPGSLRAPADRDHHGSRRHAGRCRSAYWLAAGSAGRRPGRRRAGSRGLHRGEWRHGHAQLLADWPDLDAVFVANDLMARGALSVLAPGRPVGARRRRGGRLRRQPRRHVPAPPAVHRVPTVGADGAPDGRAAAGPAGWR